MILGCTGYPSHPEFKGYLGILHNKSKVVYALLTLCFGSEIGNWKLFSMKLNRRPMSSSGSGVSPLRDRARSSPPKTWGAIIMSGCTRRVLYVLLIHTEL